MSARVAQVGPLFDGRARHWAQLMPREIERRIADVGSDMVRQHLKTVVRKETPYYRTRIVIDYHPDRAVINDDGVIYGPWLEGTGSRNKTTRFKGYATFRKVSQLINKQSKVLAIPVVTTYCTRVNG